MKKLNCELSISRPTTNYRDDNFLRISFRDTTSRLQFFEAEVSLGDFMLALTGQIGRPAIVELRGEECVGKKRVMELRKRICPMKGHRDPDVFSDWLRDHAQEEGWEVDTYLGRKGAVEAVAEGTMLYYSVFKYVEVEPEPEEVK